jgi:hypothetical protein
MCPQCGHGIFANIPKQILNNHAGGMNIAGPTAQQIIKDIFFNQ